MLSSLRGVLVLALTIVLLLQLVLQLLTEALVVRCGASDQRRDAAQVPGGPLAGAVAYFQMREQALTSASMRLAVLKRIAEIACWAVS